MKNGKIKDIGTSKDILESEVQQNVSCCKLKKEGAK